MESLKEKMEHNVVLTVLSLLLAGFVAGYGVNEILDARAPEKVSKNEFDELKRLNTQLSEAECPNSFENEFRALSEEYDLLANRECPPSFEAQFRDIETQFEQLDESARAQLTTKQNLIEILEKKTERLESEVEELTAELTPKVGEIAPIDSIFVVHGMSGFTDKIAWSSEISWKDIFQIIAPYLEESPSLDTVNRVLSAEIAQRDSLPGYGHEIDDQNMRTISVQLEAYGIVKTEYLPNTANGMSLFWFITRQGEQFLLDTRVVK